MLFGSTKSKKEKKRKSLKTNPPTKNIYTISIMKTYKGYTYEFFFVSIVWVWSI